eukprot:scaffold2502_cov78-Cylindrotheca_fusiformis.AAC.1
MMSTITAVRANNNNKKNKTLLEMQGEKLPSLEEQQKGLPEEMKQRRYKWERDLLNDMDDFCLSDYHIIRDKDGHAVWREMPGKEHNGVVDLIQVLFDNWRFTHGQQVRASTIQNLLVSDSEQGNAIRLLDVGLWGPTRLYEDGAVRIQDRETMNPHVIIEVSLIKHIDGEKAVIKDVMNHAGIGEYAALGRPNVSYLIKILQTEHPLGSPVYGFDVYEVRQDQRTPDNPTLQYRVGGNEDGDAITIIAEDLGLENPPPDHVFTVPFARITISFLLL